MASFTLMGDTTLRWIGRYTHVEAEHLNPRFVQITLMSDFVTTGPNTTETIWCRVTLFGRDKIYCVIDNIPDFTDAHGLSFNDNITIQAGNILQMR